MMNPGVSDRKVMNESNADFIRAIKEFYIIAKSFFVNNFSLNFSNDIKTEKDFINYLNTFLFKEEEKNNGIINFLKDNFSLRLLDKGEKIVDYSKPFSLILLPFEKQKTLNIYFVKFLIYSNLVENFVGCFGFTSFDNIFFYVDRNGNLIEDLNGIKKMKDKIVIERKKHKEDDKEIESRVYFIRLIENLYQNNDFLILEMPNLSFLLTCSGVFRKFYNLGYSLNKLEELFFSNFFLENSKELKERIKIEKINADLENFYVIENIK